MTTTFNDEKTIERINASLKKAGYPTIKEWEIDGRGNNYHCKVFAKNGTRKVYEGLGYAKYNPNDRRYCVKCGHAEKITEAKHKGITSHPFTIIPRNHSVGRKLAVSKAVQDMIESYKEDTKKP